MTKIQCGGFYIDDEALEIKNNTLGIKSGGSADSSTKIPIIEYGEKTLLVDTTTVLFSKDGDNDWYISAENPLINFNASSFGTIGNNLFLIEWDGIEYTLFTKEIVDKKGIRSVTGTGLFNWFFLGNVYPLGYISTEYEKICPFSITKSYLKNNDEIYIFSYDAKTSHTIKITIVPFTKTICDPILYADINECGYLPYRYGTGRSAVVEGYALNASGQGAHAEGGGTIASGTFSHAEGTQNTASGNYSHAEGKDCVASGNYSHAENRQTTASGGASHSENLMTIASGNYSHAEGRETTASGNQSHAGGRKTIANHASQVAFGQWNIADNSSETSDKIGNYIEIVGNGTADDDRSNARTLDWAGNEVLAGKLTVGSAPTNDMDVATKKYVDDNSGGGNTKEPVKIVFVNNRTVFAQLGYNDKVNIVYARESMFTVDNGDLAELTIDGEIYTGTLEYVESDIYNATISKDNKTATIEIQQSSAGVIDDDLFGFIVGESYTFTIKVIPKNQPKETVIITFEPDSYDMSGATGHCNYTPKDIVDLIDNGYNVVFELMGWVSNPIYKFTVTEATCVKADGLLFTSMMPNNLVLCSYQYITNHASAITTLSVDFTLYPLS